MRLQPSNSSQNGSAFRFGSIVLFLLIVAFISLAIFKAMGRREVEQSSRMEAADSESLRRFWDTYRQASLKRAAGELEAAAELYRAAIELRPNHEDSLYYGGNCYFELGRYDEAIAFYQRLIAINPAGSSRGYVQLALVHAWLDPAAPFDLDQAEQYFQRAMRVDPDSGAMLGIGEVAILRGRWDEALDALQKDNADNAMSMATPYLLGYLSWRKGEKEQAWRWFQLAVQRGELQKPAVKWTQEGDLKADPELRWRALARQSITGRYWLRARTYLKDPALSPAKMETEYQAMRDGLARATGKSRS